MTKLFAGNNSHVLRVDNVTDKDKNVILDATVSATLYKNDGTTEVSGYTWPVNLPHVLDGLYEGILPADVPIVVGELYVLKIVAQKGTTQAEWEGDIPAQKRKLDD